MELPVPIQTSQSALSKTNLPKDLSTSIVEHSATWQWQASDEWLCLTDQKQLEIATWACCSYKQA